MTLTEQYKYGIIIIVNETEINIMKNLNVIINFDLDETKWIWFDCDGTWIDLYGVNGWLEMLINKDVTPYAIAKPLLMH